MLTANCPGARALTEFGFSPVFSRCNAFAYFRPSFVELDSYMSCFAKLPSDGYSMLGRKLPPHTELLTTLFLATHVANAEEGFAIGIS